MTDATAAEVAHVAERSAAVLDELERAVIGKRAPLTLVWLTLLANGHVLIEDNPGLAKTLVARSLTQVCGLRFARVQFTPDLMPADITGGSVYDQRAGTFAFRPGPVFTQVLLADEINRAPAKTQAALLEAMEERQVTSDDETRPLPSPFLVIATQNPLEYEGTYPLPEAQIDRFLARVSIGYPDAADESEMVLRRAARGTDEVVLRPMLDAGGLLGLQRQVERVHVDPGVADYIVQLVGATRAASGVAVGASPRGSLALLKLSRAAAALDGRDFVTPDDVKGVALPALGHRLVLRPELWVQDVDGAAIVRQCLEQVPVPPATLRR